MWRKHLKLILGLGLSRVILPDKNYIDKVKYSNKRELMIIEMIIKVSQSYFTPLAHFHLLKWL